jgi:ketosteroid isomerase-like protein
MPNLLLLTLGIAALAAPHADRDEVARLDTAYQEAVKRNDAETMKKIMHPRFVLVLGDGRRFNRENLLNDARQARFKYQLQDEEANSRTVMVWGDTAIVTAKLLMKGTIDGKPFDRTLWFSDTYVRTEQGWKYYFGQASLPLPGESRVDPPAETGAAN